MCVSVGFPRPLARTSQLEAPYLRSYFEYNLDDVIKWKHFPRYWPFMRGIHRSPVNTSHKGQWRGALMFSLICSWTNGWVNNRDSGDLRRHHAHYDAIVIILNYVFTLRVPVPYIYRIRTLSPLTILPKISFGCNSFQMQLHYLIECLDLAKYRKIWRDIPNTCRTVTNAFLVLSIDMYKWYIYVH